jgi:beta-adrenergic-receptor kinase
LYKNFHRTISERWQTEVSETVFDTINNDYDKKEQSRRKPKSKFGSDEKESGILLYGYLKKLGGPFAQTWQTRYAKLYPNRLELHSDNSKPELIFMEQIEDVNTELQQVKSEQSIILRTKEGKIVLTNSDEIGLKEWSMQLLKTLRDSKELLSGLRKAGKIYGTRDGNSLSTN